jgi:chromosome segregation ATPase
MDNTNLLQAIEHMLDNKLDDKLGAFKGEMNARFDSMQGEIRTLQSDVSTMKGDISTLKSDVSTLKTDVSTLRDDMDSRFDSVQNDISTMQGDISTLKSDVNGTRVLIEMDVHKRISLLYEGHSLLNKKLDRLDDLTEKVEDIQSTVSVLKYMVVNQN